MTFCVLYELFVSYMNGPETYRIDLAVLFCPCNTETDTSGNRSYKSYNTYTNSSRPAKAKHQTTSLHMYTSKLRLLSELGCVKKTHNII